MKICTKCQENKNEQLFSSKRGKLDSQCKLCKAYYARKYYQLNSEKVKSKVRKSSKKYYERNKLYVNVYKSTHGCKYCFESDSCCLDFHHISPELKTENISMLIVNSSIENVKKEIEKCEVVCANCHRKHHAGIKLVQKDFQYHG